jgi:hypothetical protein
LALDSSPLFLHPHADDVADLGRRLLGRAEVEMIQDPPDRQRVDDVGHDFEQTSAASADEGIRLKHLARR